jgi:hypothetical protein
MRSFEVIDTQLKNEPCTRVETSAMRFARGPKISAAGQVIELMKWGRAASVWQDRQKSHQTTVYAVC